MKQALAAVLLGSALSARLWSQDAVALAQQQEAEERYKRLTATVEEVQIAQAAQQKQISALVTELNRLREEVARANQNAGTQDAIKRLSDQIMKVDEARVADNKRIYEALEKLGATIKSLPATAARPRTGPESSPPPAHTAARGAAGSAVEGEFFEYTVQLGDTLDRIVRAYREQNFKVTLKSVMDANPNVNWNRLQIGQKILIPKPKP